MHYRCRMNLFIKIKKVGFMSERFKKPAVFSLLIIIVLFVFLTTGCKVDNSSASSATNITQESVAQTVENTGSLESTDNITESTENDLAGTCLRGRSCSYPGQCNEYTDLNNNGLCDLGEA